MAQFVFPSSDQPTSPPTGSNIDIGSFHIPESHDGVLEVGHRNSTKLENALAYVDWIYDNTEKGDMKPTVESIPFARASEQAATQTTALTDALQEAVPTQQSPEMITAYKLRNLEFIGSVSTQLDSLRKYEVTRASNMFAAALRSQGEK